MGNRAWIVGGLAVVVAAFAAGFASGHQSVTTTHTAVGQAYSTRYEITVTAGGWAYAIPLDVPWTDASGASHDGGRPSCVPPTGVVNNVHFEWTAWRSGAMAGRAVVHVDCP